MSTHSLVQVLPDLDRLELNVKVVAAISQQLFRMQSREYKEQVVGPADRADAMVITNGAFKLMQDWVDGSLVREYSLSADWDDRWRSGGNLDEVMEEAHLDPAHILTAIRRFVNERPQRVETIKRTVDAVRER